MALAHEDWEEHTEIVPRVVLARRQRALQFLALSTLAFSVAAASFVIPKKHHVDPVTADAITADAQQIGVKLSEAFNQTSDRAEGFAGTPVLEAGILTDAATVADIVKTEYRLKTRPGETLELFQLKGDAVTSLVRVPPEAPPIAFVKDNHARIENRDGLAVVVGAEVAPYDNNTQLAGQLAVAVKVDLAKVPLAQHATEANLVGGGPPIPIVTPHGKGGPAITVPVPLDPKWQLGTLSLATSPVMSAYHASWVMPVRYGGLGLGVVLLSTFLVAFRGALKK